MSLKFFVVYFAIFLGGANVNAEVLCCRKVNNITVKQSLITFIRQQNSGIQQYFNSVNSSGLEIDVDSSVFIIDPQKLSQVRIRIAFYRDKKSNINGDISLEILVNETQYKKR